MLAFTLASFLNTPMMPTTKTMIALNVTRDRRDRIDGNDLIAYLDHSHFASRPLRLSGKTPNPAQRLPNARSEQAPDIRVRNLPVRA